FRGGDVGLLGSLRLISLGLCLGQCVSFWDYSFIFTPHDTSFTTPQLPLDFPHHLISIDVGVYYSFSHYWLIVTFRICTGRRCKYLYEVYSFSQRNNLHFFAPCSCFTAYRKVLQLFPKRKICRWRSVSPCISIFTGI